MNNQQNQGNPYYPPWPYVYPQYYPSPYAMPMQQDEQVVNPQEKQHDQLEKKKLLNTSKVIAKVKSKIVRKEGIQTDEPQHPKPASLNFNALVKKKYKV